MSVLPVAGCWQLAAAGRGLGSCSAGKPASSLALPHLSHRRGLLQVDAAYKYLRRSVDVDVPAGKSRVLLPRGAPAQPCPALPPRLPRQHALPQLPAASQSYWPAPLADSPDCLCLFPRANTADLRFEVSARRSDSSAARRGIYLREPEDARQPLTFQ